MSLFKGKRDPLSEREREIQAEIEQLERQIREASQGKPASGSKPPPKQDVSSVVPLRKTPAYKQPANPAPSPQIVNREPKRPASVEPIFEPLDRERLRQERSSVSTPAHFNELGVRKYDLAAAWDRFKGYFRSPSASNPKLVNYLAAGSIHGLRALRYEKRIARRRFIFFSLGLLLLLIGIAGALLRRF